jgi:hypothetical protein
MRNATLALSLICTNESVTHLPYNGTPCTHTRLTSCTCEVLLESQSDLWLWHALDLIACTFNLQRDREIE